MIYFETERGYFSYRVIGVAIHKKKILLHKSQIGEYWSLPGGRCEILEDSKTAIEREMLEEMHSKVKVGRILNVNENFFTYKGKPFHEIGIYYEITFTKDAPIWKLGNEFQGLELGKKKPVTFRWFSSSDLKKVDVKPKFIRDYFKPSFGKKIIHAITRD